MVEWIAQEVQHKLLSEYALGSMYNLCQLKKNSFHLDLLKEPLEMLVALQHTHVHLP